MCLEWQEAIFIQFYVKITLEENYRSISSWTKAINVKFPPTLSYNVFHCKCAHGCNVFMEISIICQGIWKWLKMEISVNHFVTSWTENGWFSDKWLSFWLVDIMHHKWSIQWITFDVLTMLAVIKIQSRAWHLFGGRLMRLW